MEDFYETAYKNIKNRAYKNIYKSVQESCRQWWQFFFIQMNKPKSGRTYYYKGQKHIASAPGKVEYPAEMSGEFLNTLEIKPNNFDPDSGKITISITSSVSYAPFLNTTRKLFQESKDEFFDQYFKRKFKNG